MGKSKGRRSSIRWKLRLALLTMAVPILLLGGLGIWAIDSSTTMFEAAADEQVTDSLTIIGLRDNLITSEWWSMEYANEGKKKARGRFLALVPKIETGFAQILSMDTGTERATAERIAESWSIAGKVGVQTMALPPGSSDTEVEYPLEDFHPAVEQAIGDLVELNEESLEDMRAEVHAKGAQGQPRPGLRNRHRRLSDRRVGDLQEIQEADPRAPRQTRGGSPKVRRP